MAKVIEFYIPKTFRKPLSPVPQLQAGKVIEFPQTRLGEAKLILEVKWLPRFQQN